MRKYLLKIMDKKVINEEQFRKLVISEAKKILSEEESSPAPEKNIAPTSKKRLTFDKVESLIREMEQMPKSIKSISLNDEVLSKSTIVEDKSKKPNRDLDVNEHNKKKNIIHVNEGEKDKWSRMMKYQIPSDENR
jgi:hypothetical protein